MLSKIMCENDTYAHYLSYATLNKQHFSLCGGCVISVIVQSNFEGIFKEN